MNPHELMDPLIVDTHHGMNSPGLSATSSSCGKHDSGYITRTLQQQQLQQHHQLQQQQQLQHRHQLSLQRLSKLSELFPMPNSYYFNDGKTSFLCS